MRTAYYILLAAVTLESCMGAAWLHEGAPALRVAQRSPLVALRGGGDDKGAGADRKGGDKKGGDKKLNACVDMYSDQSLSSLFMIPTRTLPRFVQSVQRKSLVPRVPLQPLA